jgi:transposase
LRAPAMTSNHRGNPRPYNPMVIVLIAIEAFLVTHRNVHLHFTPTYSSWLNQVELWFAKIERDVIERGVFTSVPDLKRNLLRYIRRYNQEPKPVKWKYFDPTRRITPESIVTDH